MGRMQAKRAYDLVTVARKQRLRIITQPYLPKEEPRVTNTAVDWNIIQRPAPHEQHSTRFGGRVAGSACDNTMTSRIPLACFFSRR